MDKEHQRRFALIIANNDYQDPDFQKLIAPAQDAKALASVLKDPAIGDFEVKALLNEPSYKVNEEIEAFFSDRKPDDLLLLYFSCHGIKDQNGHLYFATINTRRKLLGSTAVSANFVNNIMLHSRSKRQVLLLDCCYSGAFARGLFTKADKTIHTKEQFQGRGRVVLTATDAMQYSFEGNVVKGVAQPSIFTRAIVDGLQTGQADMDKNGLVSYDELYDFTFDRVIDITPLQKPGKWVFDIQGDIVIAKNPNKITSIEPISKEIIPKKNTAVDKWRINQKNFITIMGASAVATIVLLVVFFNSFSHPISNQNHQLSIPIANGYSFLKKWGDNFTGKGQLRNPWGVAVDYKGDVYVADWGNNRVQKFDNNGKLIQILGSGGSENGNFSNPFGIAADHSGSVYVSETGNNRVQKFDGNGNFITNWGIPGIFNSQFNSPQGIAVDSKGNVYVADNGNNRVQKFDSDGHYITQWGKTGSQDGNFSGPAFIVIDSHDYVYVSDSNNNRVQKFDGNGNFITNWGSSGSDPNQFNGPEGIAVDSKGNVYVADNGNNRVQKFDNNGTRSFNLFGNQGGGKTDSKNIGFEQPTGIAVDFKGDVYIADNGNNRVQKFDSDGHYITQWGSNLTKLGQFDNPQGIALDPKTEHTYVADTDNNRIQKFDSNGTFITSWGSTGSDHSQFIGPIGIAVDSKGNVYVADVINNRVQKFDSDGHYITQWGKTGSQDGNFTHPNYIAVDSNGNVYVTDFSNNRIQKFDNNGHYITQWGSSGSDPKYFNGPEGIAVDSAGYVYVADSGNNRIQKFDSNGTYITNWGKTGSENGNFSGPIGVSVDSAGYVYVVDNGNNRIQKFDSNGRLITQWGVFGWDPGSFNHPEDVAIDPKKQYVYVTEKTNNRVQVFFPFSYVPK